MKNVFKNPKSLILACLCIIVITAAAWQVDEKNKGYTTRRAQSAGDTTQPKQRNNDKDEFRMKDLDDAMKELDIEMKNLDLHLKDLDINIAKEVNEALAKIDFNKIGKEVEESLAKVDFDEISKEVEAELKKIDFDKIKIEVNNSLKEAQEEIKKIDMEQLHKEMLELQQNFNSDKFKKEIDEAMKGAKQEIEKAKRELQDLKNFTNELEKDGLIDKKKGYTIEWKKEGDLYINGKQQPKEISDKYSHYYRKDGYKIRMGPDDDDLEIESL